MSRDSEVLSCFIGAGGERRAGARRTSIIIPHLNDHARLRDCLLGVKAQTEPPFEVLVAENGSFIDMAVTTALVQELEVEARVLAVAERGAGPARNAGVEATSGEVLVFLDADCRPEPGWLAQGVASTVRSVVVGGPMLVVPLRGGPVSDVEAWDMVFGHDGERSHRRNQHLLGGNMFISRDVFERVGPFRNGFPEDRDWCERARAAGYEIAFDPLLVVKHPPLSSYADLERRWTRMTTEEHVRAGSLRWGRLRFALRSWLVLLSIAPHLGLIVRFKMRGGEASGLGMARILFRIRYWRFVLTWRLLLHRRAI